MNGIVNSIAIIILGISVSLDSLVNIQQEDDLITLRERVSALEAKK